MQYIGSLLNFIYLPVASNDNDDLLAFAAPSVDLSLIRKIKDEMRETNAATGTLLRSRKERRFFQEVVDAERYILLRYFSLNTPEITLRRLRRRILDRYLFPKLKQSRKAGRASNPS
jgi:predicted ABC-type ATPase